MKAADAVVCARGLVCTKARQSLEQSLARVVENTLCHTSEILLE